MSVFDGLPPAGKWFRTAPKRKLSTRPVSWAVRRANLIAGLMGVTFADVRGSGRHPAVSEARAAIAYILRDFAPPFGMGTLSFPEIAASMGKVNHSSSIDFYRRMSRETRERADVIAAECGLRKLGANKSAA